MVFNMLEKNRYISDGNKDTIVIDSSLESELNSELTKRVITY